jgi:hypothetical protein
MHEQKPNPRKEYRQRENQRVADSASLAETFRELKSLTVHLAHLDPRMFSKPSEMKYSVNLANAKALFRFNCPNERCVGGDFDLSAELARAVAARRTTSTGEATCQGWRSNTEIGQVRCHSILRYKLKAEYQRHGAPAGHAGGDPDEKPKTPTAVAKSVTARTIRGSAHPTESTVQPSGGDDSRPL